MLKFWLMSERRYVRIFLLIPALIVLYYVYEIFRPFWMPIVLAIILVSLSYPSFEWTCRKMNGRRGWAAFVTCLWITALIILPLVFLGILVAREVIDVYARFANQLSRENLGSLLSFHSDYLTPVFSWLSEQLGVSRQDLIARMSTALQRVGVFLLSHSTDLVSSVFTMVWDFFLMIVTMFFLFRDGGRLNQMIRSLSPLSHAYEQRIVNTFRRVARAAVLGNMATAAIQGFASGLVFLGLGISNALFWGTLSAFASLIPVLGATLVWLPWAIYFFATGSIAKGIALTVLETVVVGSIDNLVRPLLMEGRAQMHTLIVFFAVVGGIAYFGVLGMFFGPIIVALGLTFLELYRSEFERELDKAPPLDL